MSKISKAIDLLKTKYKMAMKQKIYQGEKYKVKYILEENKNSEVLLILFTSCTAKGQKARYNYMRTVEKYDVKIINGNQVQDAKFRIRTIDLSKKWDQIEEELLEIIDNN